MSRAVLWDSSAVLALLDSRDHNHPVAVEAARSIQAERRPCLTTNYLEVETHALLLRKLGRLAAREWLIRAPLPVFCATRDEEQHGREILIAHEDKDWSFCDAISFALMERREVAMAFSFDHHFVQYGRFPVLPLTVRLGRR